MKGDEKKFNAGSQAYGGNDGRRKGRRSGKRKATQKRNCKVSLEAGGAGSPSGSERT